MHHAHSATALKVWDQLRTVCLAPQVRVNFLSQLLHEGKQHLQQHLTASVLGRKLFYTPFHRGISINQQTLSMMNAALNYCCQVRGQSGHVPHTESVQLSS